MLISNVSTGLISFFREDYLAFLISFSHQILCQYKEQCQTLYRYSTNAYENQSRVNNMLLNQDWSLHYIS